MLSAYQTHWIVVEQRSLAFLATGISSVEDNYSKTQGRRDGLGMTPTHHPYCAIVVAG